MFFWVSGFFYSNSCLPMGSSWY